MSGRCEHVYVSLTSRNGLSVSQLARVLIQLPTGCTAEGVRTAVVLDRASAGRLEREMRRWGNHCNQAVHAFNRIA